jgi:hypothetical protein
MPKIKILMLAIGFILLTVGLNAQNQPSAQHLPGPPAKTSVQGCVMGSDGNYMLISDTGTDYQLFGHHAELIPFLGHEVQITGSTAGGGSSSTEMSSTSIQVLKVSKVKYISEACGRGSR